MIKLGTKQMVGNALIAVLLSFSIWRLAFADVACEYCSCVAYSIASTSSAPDSPGAQFTATAGDLYRGSGGSCSGGLSYVTNNEEMTASWRRVFNMGLCAYPNNTQWQIAVGTNDPQDWIDTYPTACNSGG